MGGKPHSSIAHKILTNIYIFAGHMGINWVIAFNFLHLAEIYCNQEHKHKMKKGSNNKVKFNSL